MNENMDNLFVTHDFLAEFGPFFQIGCYSA